MKVYVVTASTEYHGSEIVGVYHSLFFAQKAVARLALQKAKYYKALSEDRAHIGKFGPYVGCDTFGVETHTLGISKLESPTPTTQRDGGGNL